LVNVKEGDFAGDLNEPDITTISNTYLERGMHGVPFIVDISNQENYLITKVNAKIPVGGNSPFQSMNDFNNTIGWVYSQEKDFQLNQYSDQHSSNVKTIHFYVDVDKSAKIGVQKIPITVTCLDLYGKERNVIVNVEVNIYPIPPKIVVSDITTNEIEPNKLFDLTAKVKNIGGSDARNVWMLLNGTSNLFSIITGNLAPQSLNKTEEKEFVFRILAGDLDLGKTYLTTLSYSYEDELENFYSFEVNPELIIPLQVSKTASVVEEEDEIKFLILDITTTKIEPNSNF
jgi:hypothetical protein